jgi:hypothetical protein
MRDKRNLGEHFHGEKDGYDGREPRRRANQPAVLRFSLSLLSAVRGPQLICARPLQKSQNRMTVLTAACELFGMIADNG